MIVIIIIMIILTKTESKNKGNVFCETPVCIFDHFSNEFITHVNLAPYY